MRLSRQLAGLRLHVECWFSVLCFHGVGLLSATPEITVALVFGTIMGVGVLLKGIAAGPIIAAGITYCIIQVLHLSLQGNVKRTIR